MEYNGDSISESELYEAEELDKKEQTTKLQVCKTETNTSFLASIERLAINPNVDPAKLSQFMDLQERILDRNAEQAFNADMVAAQAEIKIVAHNKENVPTRSRYSDLKAILSDAKPIYTNHGFALSFYEGETAKDKHVRVMVDIMHSQGHTKTRFKDFPIDDVGIKGSVNKTQIHANQSAFMYGRRVLTCMIFNIPTGDDDDGNAAGGTAYIDEKQKSNLIDLLISIYGDDYSAFLEHIKCDSVDKIPSRDYQKHYSGLTAIYKKRNKKD